MAITSGAMCSQLTLCPKASAALLLQSPLLEHTPGSSPQSLGGSVNAEGGFRQRQTVFGAPPRTGSGIHGDAIRPVFVHQDHGAC